jgi:hypothetical protein
MPPARSWPGPWTTSSCPPTRAGSGSGAGSSTRRGPSLFANCVLDPIGNKSANRPRTGAPVPFTAGQPCPVCSGAGRIQTSATEDVVLGVNWNPKKFVLPIPASVDLRVPNAVCETKGFIALWPRLAKCDHLIVDLAVEGFSRQKFKLAGQPGSPGNIVQGRYVHAVWAMWNG